VYKYPKQYILVPIVCYNNCSLSLVATNGCMISTCIMFKVHLINSHEGKSTERTRHMLQQYMAVALSLKVNTQLDTCLNSMSGSSVQRPWERNNTIVNFLPSQVHNSVPAKSENQYLLDLPQRAVQYAPDGSHKRMS